MKVGILALQGAVTPHAEKLRALGVDVVEVRNAADLDNLAGIILPGGESTTMLHLLHLQKLWEPLQQFVKSKPSWGVCAGAILLATKVSHPSQESLAALDIEVERNAYGRQNESFIDSVTPAKAWIDSEPLEAVFIRAPRIKSVHGDTKVLLEYRNEPVMVETGRAMAATFHPELTSSDKIHRYFVKKCEA